MIGVEMGVDHITNGGLEARFNKPLDEQRFFRVYQSINNNCALAGDYNAGINLGIQITGKHVNIISDALSLHIGRLLSRQEQNRKRINGQYSHRQDENQDRTPIRAIVRTNESLIESN